MVDVNVTAALDTLERLKNHPAIRYTDEAAKVQQAMDTLSKVDRDNYHYGWKLAWALRFIQRITLKVHVSWIDRLMGCSKWTASHAEIRDTAQRMMDSKDLKNWENEL